MSRQLGAILLRGSDAEWRENVALFKRMHGQVAKVHVSLGFGTSWQDVEYLIAENPQLEAIIYRTEDRIISAEDVERDLVGRGFWNVMQQYPRIESWCEVGNEPEHVPVDHWVYRWLLLDTVTKLKPKFPGLKWLASMPTRLDHTIDVLSGDEHGRIEDLYDAIGLHCYGHMYLGDGGGGEWLAIYDHLRQHTSLPLILSEFGINDGMTAKAEKGRRYLDWLGRQPDRLIAATVFVIGKWKHDRYRVDAAMADVLGSRTIPTPEPAPEPEPEPDMLTIHSPFKASPTISEDGFVAVLERVGSFNSDALWEPIPRAERPNEARRIYRLIRSRSHDPGRFLGISEHEHGHGTNAQSVLHRGRTHSLTNARSVRDPSLPKGTYRREMGSDGNLHDVENGDGWYLYHDSQRNSSYVKYRSAYDSIQDAIYRIDDPTYAYKDAHSILEVISIFAPGKDNNDPRHYAEGLVTSLNRWQQQYPVEQEQPPMPRIIVSAGHENIRNITAAKIGAQSQANLKGGSGAGGVEAKWTAPWADHLAHLLRQMGVDVVRTDAIYHADVYSKRADLVISGHCDGTGGRKAQHCQAAAVVSGNSHDSADARAQQFVDLWYDIYPQASGIRGDGPITVGMRQYYGGWYRTPDSPMVLLEHQILADANGVRNDGIDPVRAAEIDAEVVRRFFGLADYQDAPARDPNTREFPETGHWVINIPEAPILAFYEAEGDVERFGFPLAGMTQREDGAFEQLFENALIESYPQGFGPYPGPHVRIGGLGQRFVAAQQRIKELEAA